MNELRTQHAGRPLRTLLAFEPRRCATLLIGGDKARNDRFYESMIPPVDDLYDLHLKTIHDEGLI